MPTPAELGLDPKTYHDHFRKYKDQKELGTYEHFFINEQAAQIAIDKLAEAYPAMSWRAEFDALNWGFKVGFWVINTETGIKF